MFSIWLVCIMGYHSALDVLAMPFECTDSPQILCRPHTQKILEKRSSYTVIHLFALVGFFGADFPLYTGSGGCTGHASALVVRYGWCSACVLAYCHSFNSTTD